MIDEKRTIRVSLFFSDTEYEALITDAHAADRDPHDFLRFLWLQHRRQKIRQWAEECHQKQQELAGTGLRAVPPIQTGN